MSQEKEGFPGGQDDDQLREYLQKLVSRLETWAAGKMTTTTGGEKSQFLRFVNTINISVQALLTEDDILKAVKEIRRGEWDDLTEDEKSQRITKLISGISFINGLPNDKGLSKRKARVAAALKEAEGKMGRFFQ